MTSFKINLLELADSGGVVIQNKRSELLDKVKMIYKNSSNRIDLQNAKFVKNWLFYWLNDSTKSDLFLAKSYFLERLLDRHYSYQVEYDWKDLKGILFFGINLESVKNLKEFEKILRSPLFHLQLQKYLPNPPTESSISV